MSYKTAIQGWIYCFMNYRDRTNVKIGMTLDIDERLRAANGSFQIDGFYIVIAKWVNNPYVREHTIHRLLRNKRVNPKREFFEVTHPDSLQDILDIFSLIDGHEHSKSKKTFTFRNWATREEREQPKTKDPEGTDPEEAQPETKKRRFSDFDFEGF